jgi:N6-adenosine-specific RNA methylase IME4
VITTDPEFRSLIPPLTPEELAGLEASVIAEGCRDALIVWGDILIDGHNRYEICQRHKIMFNTTGTAFDSREDVIDWIYSNQLARRNLTDESRTYLMGKQYSSRKKREGKHALLGQNVPVSTAEKIGNERGVTGKTVQRAEDYSDAIDILEETLGEEIKKKILSGEISTTKKGVIALADATIDVQKKAIDLVVSGEATTLLHATKIINHENVSMSSTLEGKYRVIYADPPWSYGNRMDEALTKGASVPETYYPCMSIEDICEIPIHEISEDNAVLFLWTTSPLLEDSFKVISAWGFKYKTSFIWDKILHNMGHYNSVRHEFLLVATRGSCTPDIKKLYDSVVSVERGEHSAKPQIFREMIDMIYPNGKRIEIFARMKIEGWDNYGNQIA